MIWFGFFLEIFLLIFSFFVTGILCDKYIRKYNRIIDIFSKGVMFIISYFFIKVVSFIIL